MDTSFSVGDYVEAGDTVNDYKSGRIFEIEGDRAYVGWEGTGSESWVNTADLRAYDGETDEHFQAERKR